MFAGGGGGGGVGVNIGWFRENWVITETSIQPKQNAGGRGDGFLTGRNDDRVRAAEGIPHQWLPLAEVIPTTRTNHTWGQSAYGASNFLNAL